MRRACAEGKRRGIEIGLHNCPGYTHTGGTWIPPRLASGYTNLYAAAEVAMFRCDFGRTVKDLYRDVLFAEMGRRVRAEGLADPDPYDAARHRDLAALGIPDRQVVDLAYHDYARAKYLALGMKDTMPPKKG